jgi:hypothetical protein
MLSVVEDMSGIPSWGNARDMETLANKMRGTVLNLLPDHDQPAELTIQIKDAITVMHSMLDERRAISNMPPISHSGFEDISEATLSSPPPPPPPPPSSPAAQQ